MTIGWLDGAPFVTMGRMVAVPSVVVLAVVDFVAVAFAVAFGLMVNNSIESLAFVLVAATCLTVEIAVPPAAISAAVFDFVMDVVVLAAAMIRSFDRME